MQIHFTPADSLICLSAIHHGNMAVLNTTQHKELAATFREIVHEEITSDLDLKLKAVNEPLTSKLNAFSTKVESLEKAANVTEVWIHDLETERAKLEGETNLLKRKWNHLKMIPVKSIYGL